MPDSLFNEKPEPVEAEGGPVYSPLAARLAPGDLSEFSGQEHILGPGKLLRRAIEADNLKSAVFFGPPGAGKTALARYIASRANAKTFDLNAVMAGVADLKKIIEFSRGLGGFVGNMRPVTACSFPILIFSRLKKFAEIFP